jgi:hypothetical protein
VYYRLYADDDEMPSKVAIGPEEPSLGRIRADFVTPPHCPLTIKLCISRAEKSLALIHADIFANLSCNTPLKQVHIPILRNDCPGLSPKEPMAIVLGSLRDGRYFIKNRAADIYWNAWSDPIKTVHFWPSSAIEGVKFKDPIQVNEPHSPIIQVFRG